MTNSVISPFDLLAGFQRIKAAAICASRRAAALINQPMITTWVQAIGDRNPIYVSETAARAIGFESVVAPPAMMQVWTLPKFGRARPHEHPNFEILDLLDTTGDTSLVATDCDAVYKRCARLGEQISVITELVDLCGPRHRSERAGFAPSEAPGESTIKPLQE